MKRKLTIAAGIIHSPSILFLDEPTTGIDVASARQIRQLIADLNTGGTTIFLTTHYIEEAERLCQRIAFIVEGQIVRTDRVEDLLRQVAGRHVVQFAVGQDAERLCDVAGDAFPSLECRALTDNALRVTSAEPLRIGPLVRLFEEHGAEVTEARVIHPSLEEVFVEVTGIEVDAMKREKEKAGKGGAS
jgi:ABC-2 type transport system ATP-binding protein